MSNPKKILKAQQRFNHEYTSDNGEDMYVYFVTSVENSVLPNINSSLSKKEIDVYCKADNWKVIIT